MAVKILIMNTCVMSCSVLLVVKFKAFSGIADI
jgi:hypothetical protein